jgi:Ca2+-binding RTX toxin-like protein
LARVLNEIGAAVVLAAAIGEALSYNAAVPVWLHYPQPDALQAVIDYGRLIQSWRMFVPDAPYDDMMISVEARTADGRLVDPYNEVASRYKRGPFTSIPTRLGNDQFFTSDQAATTPGTADGMYGGNGDDRFQTSRPNGNATAVIFGQSGNDTFQPNIAQPALFYGGGGWDSADYHAFGQAAYIKADGITHAGARTGSRNQVIDTDVERLVGTPFNDYFSGRSSQDFFYGSGGNDEMWGNGGNDVMFGEAGNDSIHGGDGNDSVYGGDGNDAVWGDAGADYISGGNGNDVLRGGDGNDSIFGDANGDSIYGDLGNDLLVGGAGSDHLFANDGQFFDNVYGDNQDGSSAAGYTDVATIDSVWIFSDHTVGVESFA